MLSLLLPALAALAAPQPATPAEETGIIGIRMRDGTLQTLVVSAQHAPRVATGGGVWFLHHGELWRLSRWTVSDGTRETHRLSVQPAGGSSVPLDIAALDGASDHTDALKVLFVGSGIVSLETHGSGYYGGAHPVHWARRVSLSVDGLARGEERALDLGAVLGAPAQAALVDPGAGLAALPDPEEAACYEASPTSWGIVRGVGRWEVHGAREATAHACPPNIYAWTLPVEARPVVGHDALPRRVRPAPGEDVLASPSGTLVVGLSGGAMTLNGAPVDLGNAEVDGVVAVAWGQDVDWLERLPVWP